MKDGKRISASWVGRKLRAQFGAGILVVVPIVIAILILVWLFNYIDSIAQPVAHSLLGRTIPGLGLGILVLLIYLTGLVATSLIGRRLIRYGESLLARVPMFRYIYSSIRQIMEAFAAPEGRGFVQVVLVEFPKQGMRAIGFITSESRVDSGEKLLNVFIPTAPNPTSGYLEIVRESDVIRTNISVDDALKMVLSGGKVSLQEVTDRLAAQS
jgi:uncharacterized membrane protein